MHYAPQAPRRKGEAVRTPTYWFRRWCRRMEWYRREYRMMYDGTHDCNFDERRPKAHYQRLMRRGEWLSPAARAGEPQEAKDA